MKTDAAHPRRSGSRLTQAAVQAVDDPKGVIRTHIEDDARDPAGTLGKVHGKLARGEPMAKGDTETLRLGSLAGPLPAEQRERHARTEAVHQHIRGMAAIGMRREARVAHPADAGMARKVLGDRTGGVHTGLQDVEENGKRRYGMQQQVFGQATGARHGSAGFAQGPREHTVGILRRGRQHATVGTELPTISVTPAMRAARPSARTSATRRTGPQSMSTYQNVLPGQAPAA